LKTKSYMHGSVVINGQTLRNNNKPGEGGLMDRLISIRNLKKRKKEPDE